MTAVNAKEETTPEYTEVDVKKLNRDIALFPQVAPITQDMKLQMNGVSRTVMLDRYSFKDLKKETLTAGDLVVLTYKDDPKFPHRGYGILLSFDKKANKAVVQLDKQFQNGEIVHTQFDGLEKPLELFYEQIAMRNARGLASVEETEEKRQEWTEKFYHELVNKNFVPAGRVLYGAGAETDVTYFNCYVMPMIHDSRGGIGDHRKKAMEIMSRGGGVGTNGSTLRPKNAICHNVNGRSSGAVSWLHDISELTNLVQQGGSRRGAQMIMLNCTHPDIVEFIISKIQNPIVLRHLIKTTGSDLIRREAEAKLDFKPLSETDRKAYEALVSFYNIDNPMFDGETPPEVKEAKAILEDGGRYSVRNPEFLSGANISVNVTHEFMDAVEHGKKFRLRFPDIENYDPEMRKVYDEKWQDCGDVEEWERMGYGVATYHTIEAKELWNLINICATYSAEPGIFFIDNANDMTNAKSYGMKVVATNPCGEQPLAPWSVCNLAAINLAEMTRNGKIDWDKLKQTVQVGVRMQDNVISATPYFLEENTKQALGERRVGMGVMGLHDLLIRVGQRYGSQESLEVIDQLFKNIAVWAYGESIELAKEKGEFPYLNTLPNGEPNIDGRKKFIETGFMKKMPQHIRLGVLEHGIRNSHLLTVAPTGSTGTLMNVSTGLEPYFSFVYYRSGRLGKFIPVVADIALEWLEANGYEVTEDNVYEMIEHLPEQFSGAMDLSPEEHADAQCVIQNWVDSSISKTVNAPKGYKVSQVAKVYERLWKGGAKGGTVYVDGSRSSQVLSLTAEDNIFDQEVDFDSEEKDATVIVIPKEQLEEIKEEVAQNIGVEDGDTCPICLAGTVIESGGCNTCNNCHSQLKCGL